MISMVVGVVVRAVGFAGRTLGRPFRAEDAIGTVRFRRRRQWDGWSCGSRSVQAIAKHFGRDVTHDDVMAGVGTTEDGTAATPIVRYVRNLGLRAGYYRHMSFGQLVRALERGGVVLVDIRGVHWSVVHAISSDHVWLANPSLKQLRRRVARATFRSLWTGLGVVVTEGARSRRPPRMR